MNSTQRRSHKIKNTKKTFYVGGDILKFLEDTGLVQSYTLNRAVRALPEYQQWLAKNPEYRISAQERDLDQQEWYTVRQAAEIADCNTLTVYRWINSGKLKASRDAQKVNSEYAIHRADLQAFLQQRRGGGQQPTAH